MNIRMGVVMDPLDSIYPQKDSTVAMMQEAQRRGWTIEVASLSAVSLLDGVPFAKAEEITVFDDDEAWYDLKPMRSVAMTDWDVILMRKDPPFSIDYIASTYVLERAEEAGVLVVNRPVALRDVNEKIFATRFSQCCPPSVVTSSVSELEVFMNTHDRIVVKPIDLMGGRGVIAVSRTDANSKSLLSSATAGGTNFVQAQRYIPDVTETGDNRILLVNGDPIPQVLKRMPKAGEFRANLAAGGSAGGEMISEHEMWICQEIGPELKKRGVYFAGIDVVGGFLTEINVTSPTGIKELDSIFGINIASNLMDFIEEKLIKEG
jgi:glutathione synthase